MSGDHIKSEISAYLAGGLPESRNRQIEAHAAACEKCRSALSKARAKQARLKREALKKADALPNLFLARQGKMAGVGASTGRGLWISVGFVILAVTGYGLWRHSSALSHESAQASSADPALSLAVSSQAAPAASASAPVPAEKAPEPPKPPLVLSALQEWKGPDSGIKESRSVVIRNGDAWQKLWMEMDLREPLPPVDFENKIVVGVFGGERPAGTSLVLGRIEEDEGVMMAPYKFSLSSVPVSSAALSTPALVGHPYLLALVPRVDKKIRLTQKEVSR